MALVGLRVTLPFGGLLHCVQSTVGTTKTERRRARTSASTPLRWASVDPNHRPHPYQDTATHAQIGASYQSQNVPPGSRRDTPVFEYLAGVTQGSARPGDASVSSISNQSILVEAPYWRNVHASDSTRANEVQEPVGSNYRICQGDVR